MLLWKKSRLCFRKFPVAKKFMDKRGGEYQDFPPKVFRLTVPKKNRRGTPRFFRMYPVSKNLCLTAEITIFNRKFVSQGTQKLQRESLLCFTIFLVSKRTMHKRGEGVSHCRDFLSEGFVSQFRKNS